jgi:hypothetical protein
MFYVQNLFPVRSRVSSVGIATGYELGDREVGVRVPAYARIFSSPLRPDRLYPIDTGLYFPGGKGIGT